MAKKILTALLALFTAITWSGCSTVPITGPVEYHQLDEAPFSSGIRVAPLPPSPGADPALIVEGFLHAMSVYQPSYGIARQYLTPMANAVWNPDAGATIYDGQPQITEDKVVLVAPVIGTLDPRGLFQAGAGQTIRQDFEVIKDAQGEWRIANPPDGLLISKYLFTAGYVNLDRHYLNLAGTALIPDPVWISIGEDQLLRSLRLQALKPSQWLEPLVLPTPRYSVNTATTVMDRVIVSLGAQANAMSLKERNSVLAELALTIAQFGSYSSFQVEVSGKFWTIEGRSETELSLGRFANLSPVARLENPEVFAVLSEEIVRMKPDQLAIPFSTQAVQAEGLAVSADRSTVVILDVNHAQIQQIPTDESQPILLREGKALLRPAFSRSSELWTASSSGTASFQVQVAEITNELIVAEAPAGKLIAFSLAPDGDRIALALETETGPIIGLMRISRGEQITLDGWWQLPLIGVEVSKIIDLAWSGPSELLVLVADLDGTTSVLRVTQDAARIADIGPSNMISLLELAAAPGYQALARTGNGMVYRLDADFTWTPLLNGASAVTYSG